MLVDPETEKILLFDFDWATNKQEYLLDNRDDVSGVLYTLHEIVTKDTHLTKIPHRERNIDMMQSIEWTCRSELDSDVSKFRKFLDEWVAKRAKTPTEQFFSTPKLTWPDLPDLPDYSLPFELGRTAEGEPNWQTGGRTTRTAREKGQYCFEWQRPPQSRLLKAKKDEIEAQENVLDAKKKRLAFYMRINQPEPLT